MGQIFIAASSAASPVMAGEFPVDQIFFDRLALEAGASATRNIMGFETVWVLASGTADFAVDGQVFNGVGGRASVWDGKADAIYAGPGAQVEVASTSDCEILVGGGRWRTPMAPFRIRPEEIEMVDVGSNETKSRRRIFHILGQNGVGRAGNLLISELYADEGCWSGYPSHKHGEDGERETHHQEVYHWRFNPPSGFGAQLWYDDTGERTGYVTREGDTFAFDGGYHPTVTSPGHASYIFTILVGRTQRSLIQNFEPAHRRLMDKIPGIAAMREKFK
jgi:5-deoxy-glucuronate isomerase